MHFIEFLPSYKVKFMKVIIIWVIHSIHLFNISKLNVVKKEFCTLFKLNAFSVLGAELWFGCPGECVRFSMGRPSLRPQVSAKD